MALGLDAQIGLAIVAGLGLVSFGVGLVRLTRAATARRPRPPQFSHRSPSQKPDRPLPFGWSTAWLAIRSRDTLAVIDALALAEPVQTPWQQGLAAVHDEATSGSHVFVTPAIAGWTFVVGYALPHPSPGPGDPLSGLLASLSKRMGEAQAYFSAPPLELYGWSRFTAGKPVRQFAAAGPDVLVNAGAPDVVERALDIALPPARGLRLVSEGGGAWSVCEEHVLAMAGTWSLDPSQLDGQAAVPGLGFLAKAPAAWRLRPSEKARRNGVGS